MAALAIHFNAGLSLTNSGDFDDFLINHWSFDRDHTHIKLDYL
jgi:hypothetical protein